MGSCLVPKLLSKGYRVKVIDTFWFGENVLDGVRNHPSLTIIKGDIRDHRLVEREVSGADAVIHLAAISNDPSSELSEELAWSVNAEAAINLVKAARAAGVRRFINASSASVYGIKETPEVAEDAPMEPITVYGKTKAVSERAITEANDENFTTVSVRPATIAGYSPRMRLDLTINILTHSALNRGEIIVFGGQQMRPTLHMDDMTDFYIMLLEADAERIGGQVFNVAYGNYKIVDLAEKVRSVVNPGLNIRITPTKDTRSYHISTEKVRRILGYQPRYTVEDMVENVKRAFQRGLIPNPEDKRYYNVEWMKLHRFK